MSTTCQTGDYNMSITTGLTYGQNYIYPSITTTPNTGSKSLWWNETITTTAPPINPGSLTVEGDSEFKGDIKIKGKSLLGKLESIEDRLAILHPNPELEEKWENLRGLRKMYMDLEKEILEQEKMWAILKK